MRDRSFFVRGTAVLLAVVISAVIPTLAAVGQPALPNPGNVGISRQDQEQLGLKAMGEVYKQMPVLPDSSPVTQYVQQLGKKLVAVIPQQYNWPYQFHVVQEKDINAFALPGGPLFINVGTINAADNEAELAGVIAHEMSHVYMQHSAKQMKQNVGPSILAGLGQILGSMIGGVGGAVASMGGQITGGLLSMKYSRKDEAQADAVGAIIMYKAGYDPRYMAQFFQKLEQSGGAAGPQMLSDHPNPGNRVAAVDQEIKNWPAKTFANNTPRFTQAKAQAQGVKAYTAEQIAQMAKTGQIHNQVPQGVPTASTEGAPQGGQISNVSLSQVMPSGQFQTFDSAAFSIQHPSNWQVQQDQSSGGVSIAPSAGVAQGSIAYGVVINGVTPQQQMSLDQATQALISGMQQSNPGLNAIGTPQNINVNGQPGKSVDLTGNSPIQGSNGQPVKERDWLVDMQRPDGTLVYVVFVSPESEFGKLRPTFEQMLKSFRTK